MEAIAPKIGMPAATKPPNTTIITRKLTGRAMPSPVRRSTSSCPVIASTRSRTPPDVTVAPSPAVAVRTAAVTWSPSAWKAASSGRSSTVTTVT